MNMQPLLAVIIAAAILVVPMTAISTPLPVELPPDPLPVQASQSQVEETVEPSSSSSQVDEPPSKEQPTQQPPQQEDGPEIYTGAPGSFKILDKSSGRVSVVQAIDYVRGAVAAEMPALFHPEALKAQAVAAYTYAVRQAVRQRANPEATLKGADFEADPKNRQVYITEKQAKELYGDQYDLYWGKVCAAVDEVMGYILVYDQQPIAAAYHAISAGRTEAASNIWQGEDPPYLAPVESPGDLLASGYKTTVRVDAQDLGAKMRAAYPGIVLPKDVSSWIQILERSDSGYVTQVSVGGQVMKGQELRTMLELRSSHFEVSYSGGAFTFTVLGYGHGAGLSQNGADYMARQGATFDEILLHYYPGATLTLAKAE